MTTPKLQTFEKNQSKINFTINRISSNFDTITGALTDSSGAFTPAAPLDALASNGMQINGSMEVSQELGTGARVGGGYIADVWMIAGAGTYALSSAQVTDAPPGLSNSVKISVTTAQASIGSTDFAILFQSIEGFRTSRLALGTANAQSLSIGFWTKTHRTGPYSGSIRNSAVNRSNAFTFTQNAADTWQYNTVTVSGDVTGTWIGNTNGTGLLITFAIAAGSTFQTAPNVWTAGNFNSTTGTTNGVAALTDTFQITGVVILPGNEMPSASRSALIMRPFPEELLICQRYYEQVGMTMTTTGQFNNTSWYKANKRAVPTLTLFSGTTTGTVSNNSSLAFFRQNTNAGSNTDTIWAADARL